jgi:hypothetical protein
MRAHAAGVRGVVRLGLEEEDDGLGPQHVGRGRRHAGSQEQQQQRSVSQSFIARARKHDVGPLLRAAHTDVA